ncbi:unnamed protein product [Closterium sp. Naga37s-1]|nr:unnamed protein product [Closterium sp. Naga37s-1]
MAVRLSFASQGLVSTRAPPVIVAADSSPFPPRRSARREPFRPRAARSAHPTHAAVRRFCGMRGEWRNPRADDSLFLSRRRDRRLIPGSPGDGGNCVSTIARRTGKWRRQAALANSEVSYKADGSDPRIAEEADCVVVGGGISGLSAAFALATRHADAVPRVLVTEARERVGGNVTTTVGETGTESEGYVWEEGPHSFQPSDAMLQCAVSYRVTRLPGHHATMVEEAGTESERFVSAVPPSCASLQPSHPRPPPILFPPVPIFALPVQLHCGILPDLVLGVPHAPRYHSNHPSIPFPPPLHPLSFPVPPSPIQLDCGILPDLVLGAPDAPRYVFWDGKLRPIPSGPADLISSDLLTLGGKLRAALGFVGIRAGQVGTELAQRGGSKEESVSHFMSHSLWQHELAAAARESGIHSCIFAGDAEQMSMQAAFHRIWRMEAEGGSLLGGMIQLGKERKEKQKENPADPRDPRLPKPQGQSVGSFRSGLATLTRAMADRLGTRVWVGWRLVGMQQRAGRGAVLTYDTPRGTTRVAARSVLLTVPAYVAADVIRAFSPTAAAALAAIPYPPMASVALSYPAAAIREGAEQAGGLRGYGQLHPRSQGLATLGETGGSGRERDGWGREGKGAEGVWAAAPALPGAGDASSALFPNRAPDGRVLLISYVGGAGNDAVAEMTHTDLIAAVDRDMRTTLLRPSAPPPLALGVRVWPRAVPQLNIGHLARIEAAKRGIEEAGMEGVFLGGNYLTGVALSWCVEGGYENAVEIEAVAMATVSQAAARAPYSVAMSLGGRAAQRLAQSTHPFPKAFFSGLSLSQVSISGEAKSSHVAQTHVASRRGARCDAATAGSDGKPRVRFAPSPTGNLHVGGARTALFNWLFARATGGKFVLRVEDTDLNRSTPESEAAMVRDLRWLGLDWDEGPDVGGPLGPYRQSERNEIYRELTEKLLASGMVYRCFCSDEELAAMKAEQEAKKLPPKYAGKWARASEDEVAAELAKGTPHSFRFRVPPNKVIKINDLVRGEVAWNTDTLGDFVVLRSNGQPVYNFCVTVDDATMKISHVIRAEEHLPNTLRQALIYEALGLPMPTFGHVSLILAPDRSKLSKRHGATSVGQFKDMGFLSEAMVNYLALLGWNDGTEDEIFTPLQLVEKFSLSRVTKSAAIFDNAKLRWINGQHFRQLSEEASTQLLAEQWHASGLLASADATSRTTQAAAALVRNGLELVTDADAALEALLAYPLKETLASEDAKAVVEDGLEEVRAALLAEWESGALLAAVDGGAATWKKWIKGFGKASGRKGKRLFMPIRVLLTGCMHGPDVGETLTMPLTPCFTLFVPSLPTTPCPVPTLWQGKRLFMPIRILLTGCMHGPDVGETLAMLQHAAADKALGPKAHCVGLEERISLLRDADLTAAPAAAEAVAASVAQ